MRDPNVLLLASLGAFLLVLMLKQALSRKVDLFSLRNLYLVGFLVYQISSPAVALHYGEFAGFRINFPDKTGTKFFLFALVFTVVFLFSYHRIKVADWLAQKGKCAHREINETVFLILASFMVLLALILRFYAVHLPGIGKASTQIGIAVAAIASAIAGWVWGNRRLNIPVSLAALAITGASVVVVMVGAFGRRPLLAVLLSFAWGAYHRRFKFMNVSKMVASLLPLMLIVGVALSAFTAIRDNRETAESDVRKTLGEMKNAPVTQGAKNILTGQAVGSASLWTLEEWPERREPKYFNSLKFMGYWWVPRVLWPDKPSPLGNHIARYAKLQGVNWDLITIPPGVIGYSAAEGGLIAVIIYALFYSQFLKFFDRLVALNPTNFLIILPVGCASAQVLGLARGCIAIFADLAVLGFLSTFFFLYIASKLFGTRTMPVYWQAWPQQVHSGNT